MKPDKGTEESDLGEMEERDMDPEEMMKDLGLLIIEARTPSASVKGRVEGPHCPTPDRVSPQHQCSAEGFECSRANKLQQYMEVLWRNAIPACIDVLLFPKCKHAEQEPLVLEDISATKTDECVLLERWHIQVFQKRHGEKQEPGSVLPSLLMQAVRSYLHFSQLSSWLLSTGGMLPLAIIFRLYAPGEGVGIDFQQTPDKHNFPVANLMYFGVKVSVFSLPRQDSIISLICSNEVEGAMGGKYPAEETVAVCRPKQRLVCEDSMLRCSLASRSAEKCKRLPESCSQSANACQCPNSNRLPVVDMCNDTWKPSSFTTSSLQTSLPKESQRHTQSLKHHRGEESVTGSMPSSVSCNQDAKFSVSPSRQMFKEKLLPLNSVMTCVDGLLTVSDKSSATQQLHSPKVLMTTNSQTDEVITKNRYLDLSDSSDSDEWERRFLSTKIQNLASPLSPDDIHAYLSNIQAASTRRGRSSPSVCPSRQKQDEVLPISKCKFYLGEDNDEEDRWLPKRGKYEYRNNTNKLSQTDSGKFVHHAIQPKDQMGHCQDTQSSRSCVEDGTDSLLCQVSDLFKNLSLTDDSDNDGRVCVRTASHKARKTEKNVNKDAKIKNSINSKQHFSGNSFDDTSNNSAENTDGRVSTRNKVQTDHKLSRNLESKTRPSLLSVALDNTAVSDQTSKVAESTLNDLDNTIAKSATVKSRPQSLCNNHYALKKNYSCATIPTTPTLEDTMTFRRHLCKSSSLMFNHRTGLPSQSSPAPIKRKSMGHFDYDDSLTNTRAIKYALSCSKLAQPTDGSGDQNSDETGRTLSTSAPASTNCLLGNFEESVLNGRIEPIGAVDGFTAEIGASGSFCPKHVTLPVTAYFFKLSDDNAPSPYLGHINLESLGKKGYHIPKRGTVQVTLFNPNKTVVKMFVVMYNLSDMPADCQTFIRQRTLYMPVDPNSTELSYLRYLIHLRFVSSHSGKVYLHTDIRLIFARDKFEFDSKVAQYELRSFTEGPQNPKFSPKR